MKVITICGSMRFKKKMTEVAYVLEAEKGLCVIQPVYNPGDTAPTERELQNFKEAHFKKIDISDAIFVVNEGGYIGKSVSEEIEYAKSRNKEIIFLE